MQTARQEAPRNLLRRVEPGRIAAIHDVAARPATIRRADGQIDADLVEQTLTACLTMLAESAAQTGQAERALRLRGAVCALRGQVHTGGWSSAEARPRGPEAATSGRRTRQPSSAIPLTDRQREVAALISQGLTNREIADRLVIAERTADTHVENILNKLGLCSRSQVAAWAVEQGVGRSQVGAWS